MSKRLIVLGAGYLGTEIGRQARELGYDVVLVSRSGGEGQLRADLTDLRTLRKLQQEISPDAVIHCAASGRVADREAAYRNVYLLGCQNVVQAFPQAKKLFTSSTSVYGQTDRSVVTEDSASEPASVTGNILLEAERVILYAGGSVARLSGIYGDGRSYLLKRLFSGEAVIEGAGGRLLNHIHRVDAASACLYLLDQEAGVYNVSDSECLSQLKTYQYLSEQFDLPLPPVVDPSQVVASKRGFTDKCVSNKKLIDLGWQLKYPRFRDAAEEVVRSLALIPK